MRIAIPKRTLIYTVVAIVVVGVLGFNAFLYYRMNLSDGAEVGESNADGTSTIELTLVQSKACPECFDLNALVQPLKDSGQISVSREEVVEYDSRAGKKLIKNYEIDKIPVILVRGDIEKVFDLASFLQNLGRQAEDGTLIVTNIPPPYLELETGEIKGKFKAIYLTRKACTECYDVALHQQALEGLAMQPSEEEFIDDADPLAQEIIAKYAITSLPTLLLRGELNFYQPLTEVWPTVGTIEEDGTYIFRQGQDLMGPYYDLNSESVVTPEPGEPSAQ